MEAVKEKIQTLFKNLNSSEMSWYYLASNCIRTCSSWSEFDMFQVRSGRVATAVLFSSSSGANTANIDVRAVVSL